MPKTMSRRVEGTMKMTTCQIALNPIDVPDSGALIQDVLAKMVWGDLQESVGPMSTTIRGDEDTVLTKLAELYRLSSAASPFVLTVTMSNRCVEPVRLSLIDSSNPRQLEASPRPRPSDTGDRRAQETTRAASLPLTPGKEPAGTGRLRDDTLISSRHARAPADAG